MAWYDSLSDFFLGQNPEDVELPPEVKAAQEAMAKTEVNGRWQDKMSPYFEIPEGAHADELFIELEEVFHLD